MSAGRTHRERIAETERTMASNVNFGIDDMKAAPWIAATAPLPAAFIDIPGRTFSMDVEAETQEWEADNKIIDIRMYNKKTSGTVESGVMSPAIAALFGSGAVTTTGTAPNQTIVYKESATAVQKNLAIAARSYAGDGTVLELRVLKATITGGPNFDWGTGSHSGLTIDFDGIADPAGNLYHLTSFEGTAAVVEIPLV
jgi:hypothetical protein